LGNGPVLILRLVILRYSEVSRMGWPGRVYWPGR